MTQDEALKLALWALKDNQHLVADNERHAYVMEYNSIIEKCEEALTQSEQERPAPCARHCEATAFQITIKNLEAQLAQPKQEPVAQWAEAKLKERNT